MKTGANKSDQYQIKKGYEEGLKPREIAEILKLPVSVVESFEPKKLEKAIEKARKVSKANDQINNEKRGSRTQPAE